MKSARASAQLRFVGRRQGIGVALGGASWSFAIYARSLEATPHPADEIVAAAKRLCHGEHAQLYLAEGDQFRIFSQSFDLDEACDYRRGTSSDA